MTPRFDVAQPDMFRLVQWYWFFPDKEVTLTDRLLVDKFFDGSRAAPGDMIEPIQLSEEDAKRVRLWLDYVGDHVLDPSDEEYGERLETFIWRHQ